MAGINLKVQIEINGQFVQAGHITGSSFRDAAFSYDESYITSPAAHAISLSLPLLKKDFDTDATKSFFDGLLPEGFTRQCVADSIHASSDDYISFLIRRDDSAHDIPLSEMKLFLKRTEAEKFIDLKTNDEVEIKGVVFSNALGDAWIDVKQLTVTKKAPEDKKDGVK